MGSSDPFPEAPPERIYGIRKRTALRIGLAALTVALVAIWFRAPLADAWVLLWPPTELSERWFTLVMVVFLSFLIPVAIVLRLADLLYDRYLASEES
jgi:hypothetical protein